MLENAFMRVYDQFKMHFYRKMFERLDNREASLTTVETFCMETIFAMGEPTVNEFASFIGISTSNAAYKVNSLVKKGYITRVRSEKDKREYYLRVTRKYIDYYNISSQYTKVVVERMRKRFAKEECDKLEEMLWIIAGELMNEAKLPE